MISPVKGIAISLALMLISTLSHANQNDGYKVVILDGETIPKSLGRPIKDLSLAAVNNGVVEPIPYQIDEYNVGGAVYFEDWDVPMEGTKGTMDNTDKILFLLKDAGEKHQNQPYDGEFIAEIRIKNQDNEPRFVYLVEGSRLRSDEQYVRYSSEAARVETDFYDLTYDPDNHVIWKEFNIASFDGDQPFDTMKIRFDAGFITSLTTVQLNNQHVIAKPKGERIGPIRTTTQLELTIWVVEIPIFTASLQLHHYPKSLVYDMRVVIPEFRRSLIVDPAASVSLDGNGLLGGRVYTAAGPKEGALIDGQMTETDQRLIDAGFSPDKNWIYTQTNRNLDVIAFFDYVGGTNEPLSVVFMDDAELEDKPERFKGQLANVGIRLDNMPTSGFLGFVVSLFVDDKFEGPPSRFSRELRNLADIEVRDIH